MGFVSVIRRPNALVSGIQVRSNLDQVQFGNKTSIWTDVKYLDVFITELSEVFNERCQLAWIAASALIKASICVWCWWHNELSAFSRGRRQNFDLQSGNYTYGGDTIETDECLLQTRTEIGHALDRSIA